MKDGVEVKSLGDGTVRIQTATEFAIVPRDWKSVIIRENGEIYSDPDEVKISKPRPARVP